MRGRYSHRRRHLLTVVIIILAVVTASSITALFLRGFKIKDFTKQLQSQALTTPTLQVWLVETPGYNDKMDAYQAGISATGHGHGIYVLPTERQWSWIAGVYLTQDEADDALLQPGLPEHAQTRLYQIAGKKFQLDPDVVTTCQQVLTAVQNVFKGLLDLRTAINNGSDTGNLILDLTTQYNQIKSGAESLQTMNANLHHQLLATVIYTANQNILGLQEIIYPSTQVISLSTVNTALLKAIFSLDNF